MNEIVEELLNPLDEDLHYEFHERAGILEFDAGYDRNQAEQLSLLYLLKKYPDCIAGKRESYMKDGG